MMLKRALFVLFMLPPIAAHADYAGVLNASPAQTIAQLVPPDRTLVASDNYLNFVKADLAQSELQSGRKLCDGFTVGTRDKFFLVDPAGRFYPPPPAQLAGPALRWYERWTVSSCGQPGFRAFVVERAPNGLHITPALPGASHADPALEIQTLARGGALFKNNVCTQDVSILDTKIIDDANFAQHSWLEAWTVRRCASDIVMRLVRYAPDGTGNPNGTAIAVDVP